MKNYVTFHSLTMGTQDTTTTHPMQTEFLTENKEKLFVYYQSFCKLGATTIFALTIMTVKCGYWDVCISINLANKIVNIVLKMDI